MVNSAGRRIRWLAVVLVVGLAGCGYGSGADDVEIRASSPYALDGCVRHDEGQLLNLPNADGPPTRGVVLGDAPRAVVFSPTIDGNVCQWLNYGESLVANGYLVALYDYNRKTPDDHQLAGIVATVRERGARAVMLVGAGDGAYASLVGAAKILPTVNGVVALSPPQRLAGQPPVEPHIRTLQMPLLFACALNDPNNAATAVRKYEEMAPSADKQVVIVTGRSYGETLLSGAEGDKVGTALTAFLDTRTQR